MYGNFDRALNTVLSFEGGYVNHPDDAGGPTNQGVTLKTFRSLYGADVTVADLKNISPAQVRRIYLDLYWTPLNCGDLSSGVDLCVFDAGVHSGVSRAAMWLQQVVGVKVDGVIGPKTLEAEYDADPVETIKRVINLRRNFLRTLPANKTFKGGWERRIKEVHKAALGLVPDALPDEPPDGDLVTLTLTQEEARTLRDAAQKLLDLFK